MVSSVHFQLTSELNATTLTFNLTCISTGGPATAVTWTRNSRVVTDDSAHHITSQVLTDAETATYNHTLMVTGRLVGLYGCNVSNNKPSSSSRMVTLVGKNNNSLLQKLLWSLISASVSTKSCTCMYFMTFLCHTFLLIYNFSN